MNEARSIGRDGRGPSRAREVADSLTRAIHEHRPGAGRKLSEDEVGEIFGVSRTIVRAVRQRLAHDQLVTIEPHRGAFVAQPLVREAREVSAQPRSLKEALRRE